MTLLAFGLAGLGAGAIYAALGLGLVLTYSGSGVINFGYSAMAMVGTYVYMYLREYGTLTIAIPGVPSLTLDKSGVAFIPALLIALAVGALVGYLAHVLVFRPLRNAPVLTRVVASVGIMVALQAAVSQRYGTPAFSPSPILPDKVVTISGTPIPRDRFELAALVVVLAIGVWALLRFTRLGIAIRGSAENENAAAMLGWSPLRLARITWIGSMLLGTLVAILATPITNLDATTLTLIIIPAVGAALLARFRSIGICIVAGLAIGVIEAWVEYLSSVHTWLPSGTQEAVPFVAIVIAMFVGGSPLPRRGALNEGRSPIAYPPHNVGRRFVVMMVIGAVSLAVFHDAIRYALITSLIAILLCLSLVVLTGFLGQISVAQMVFAGFAGFTLSKFSHNLHIPFPISPLLSVIVACAVGVIIGIPALRVRGINLAIVTLGCAYAVDNLVFQNPAFSGGYGGSPIPTPHVFGVSLAVLGSHGDFRLPFAYFVLVIVGLAVLGVINLRRSRTGRRMLAVRANERAAAASGINVSATKLTAFALSSALAGVAGVLMGYQQQGGDLSFAQFSTVASLALLTSVFIGGVGSVGGAILGGLLTADGLFFVAINERIPGFLQYQTLIGGLALIYIAVRHTDGLFGANVKMWHSLQRQVTRRIRMPGGKGSPAALADGATTVLVDPSGSPAAGGIHGA